MNYEISISELEEMVLCIVHNQLDQDEAIKYAKSFIHEINDIEEV